MFERFTDRARKVMQLAEKEARRLNHEYVGTEHILLGLVKEAGREKRRLAHGILSRSGINYKKIKARIKKIVRPGPEPVPDTGKLPITPRGKKVIEYAIKQARSSNRRKVTMEDLLVGLLCEKEGIAYMVLKDCGVEAEQKIGAKGRPVKCKIFSASVSETGVREIEQKITKFLADGKEFIQAISLPTGFIAITVFYQDKIKGA